jgi:glycosyl-4,4'-diaponeurosporenoate acyltransferase
MIATLIAINFVGWLIVQLSIAFIFTRIPAHFFARDRQLDRIHPQEISLYLNLLQIRRWKHLLPDGARWVGGNFYRKQPASRDPAYLRRLIIETRRNETAHWLMIACCPVFFLWNPLRAWPILALYAVAANLPCIAAQRYNRYTALRLLARSTIDASKTGPGFSPEI